jgi:hypothetical protein
MNLNETHVSCVEHNLHIVNESAFISLIHYTIFFFFDFEN